MITTIRKNILLFSLTFILSLFISIYAIWDFTTSYTNFKINSEQNVLKDTALKDSLVIRNNYNEKISSLKVLAKELSDFHSIYDDSVLYHIKIFKSSNKFSHIGIADVNGNSIKDYSFKENIAEQNYFKNALAGNIAIEDLPYSSSTATVGEQMIAVPVIGSDNQVQGIIFGVLNSELISQLLNENAIGKIYTQIVDEQGNYITQIKATDALTKRQNIWQELASYKFKESSLQQIQENVQQKKSGYFSFTLNDEERFAYYAPLGFNNWYIYTAIDKNYITSQVRNTQNLIIKMICLLAISFLLLLFITIWYQRESKKMLLEAHYRTTKNEKIMQMAIEESKHIIFEYNTHTKTLLFKTDLTHTSFTDRIIKNFPDSLIKDGKVTSQSIQDLRLLFDKITTVSSCENVIQMNFGSQNEWFKLILKNLSHTAISDNNVIGIMENITEQKQKENDLKHLAERDGLTGLYNAAALKAKMHKLLQEHIDPNKHHLFVLIDLDNFKQINDTFGHLYGDFVLKETASILTNKFRQDDIIARLGGDEFVVVLLNVIDVQKVYHLFSELTATLHRTYEQNGTYITTSASLGIAIAPDDGLTFEALYKNSDTALYKAKNQGKNHFILYKHL